MTEFLADALQWRSVVNDDVRRYFRTNPPAPVPFAERRIGFYPEAVVLLVLPGETETVVGVVQLPQAGSAWYRCNVCGRRGSRRSDDRARQALSVHVALEHCVREGAPAFHATEAEWDHATDPPTRVLNRVKLDGVSLDVEPGPHAEHSPPPTRVDG